MRIADDHGFHLRTELDRAVALKDVTKVNGILANDRRRNPISASGYRRISIDNGHEALFHSIYLGDMQIFYLLIDHYCFWVDKELCFRDHADKTSWWTHSTITFAAMNNQPEMIKHLINRGCDPNQPSTGLWTQSLFPVPAERSALSWACLTRSFDSCKFLLQRSVTIHPVCEKTFWPPMICAAVSGSRELVETLLAHGTTTNGFSRGGDCALFAAVRSASTPCIDIVLESGIDVNTYHPASSQTALKTAASSGNLAAMKHLVDRGAVLHIEGDPGDSALALAAASGHSMSVKWLIDEGAAIDLPNDVKHLYSPLAHAARSGSRETVEILLEAGADPNRLSGMLQISSPLRAAVRDEDNFEIVEVLLAAGADPTAKVRDGLSPLDAAIAHKRQRSVEAMRKHTNK